MKLCHVIVVLLTYSFSGSLAMQGWPTVAFDGTEDHPEPSVLQQLHHNWSRRQEEGFVFLPKNKEEMELLHERFREGRFIPDASIGRSWPAVLMTVGSELSTRLDAGNVYFVEKYVGHLGTFADLAAHHPDKDFIGVSLFPPIGQQVGGLFRTVCCCFCNFFYKSRVVDGNLDGENFDGVTEQLNKTFNKTGRYPEDAFMRECRNSLQNTVRLAEWRAHH
jgi:hypothetical protein